MVESTLEATLAPAHKTADHSTFRTYCIIQNRVNDVQLTFAVTPQRETKPKPGQSG